MDRGTRREGDGQGGLHLSLGEREQAAQGVDGGGHEAAHFEVQAPHLQSRHRTAIKQPKRRKKKRRGTQTKTRLVVVGLGGAEAGRVKPLLGDVIPSQDLFTTYEAGR